MSRAAGAVGQGDVVIPRDAIIALMRAADVTRRALTRTLQRFDLTLPQFNVLIILRKDEELPTLEIAARLVEETPGITRLINTLQAKKYLRRRQSREDRRQQLCSLTPAGRSVIDGLIPHVKATQEAVLAGLTRGEAVQLAGFLRRLHPAAPRGDGSGV
jgi:DNA-binding MarR family transcriptional regulator